MSREDFISDNLVDMREKLRRNYAVMNAQMQKSKAAEAPPEAPAPSTAVPAVESAAPAVPVAEPGSPPAPEKSYQPLPPPLPRSAEPDDLERSKRELEGALHRDYARMGREMELLQEKQQELETFFSALTDFLKELEHTADRRQLDLLRLRYLEAQGRVQAFFGEHSAVAPATSDAPRTMGRIFAEGLPYLLGALLSALIIAAVIAFVF